MDLCVCGHHQEQHAGFDGTGRCDDGMACECVKFEQAPPPFMPNHPRPWRVTLHDNLLDANDKPVDLDALVGAINELSP